MLPFKVDSGPKSYALRFIAITPREQWNECRVQNIQLCTYRKKKEDSKLSSSTKAILLCLPYTASTKHKTVQAFPQPPENRLYISSTWHARACPSI